MKYDLSILIPARNEMFLARTVEGLLKSIRGKTEIIVVLDGEWSDPGIPDDERVTVLYHPVSVGQRKATNEAARLSKAKYVMKLDAHCILSEGFDVAMMEEMKDNYTMIPVLYNLHAFDWKCKKCGKTWYQGPTPSFCCSDKEGKVKNDLCDNTTDFERVMVWKPRMTRKSEFYRFDLDMHFQYHGARKNHPEAVGNIVETMSAQGSCFMLTREKYWELNISDEEFGSWGQQGVEVACKTWLSGGRLVTNRRAWYSHLFRTQGGDFGFPYPQSGKQIQHARDYSKKLFLENTWEGQIYPLSWLLEKFNPLPGWHDPEGKALLEQVEKAGQEFYLKHPEQTAIFSESQIKELVSPSKGIIYYTDNKLNVKLSHAVKEQIKKANLPIVSASLKPVEFGKNIHMKMERGYEAYFKQILACLEASTADIIYFCEHDWLYHPSHFEFTPPKKDTFYYNDNWWRVRSSDGLAVHYDTHLVPAIVAYREILLDHYREVVKYLTEVGFTSENAYKVGFEPGTHKRVDFVAKYNTEGFSSEYPLIDIRHGGNLTASKWSPDAFRSPKNAQNWQESKAWDIDGWKFGSWELFDITKFKSL